MTKKIVKRSTSSQPFIISDCETLEEVKLAAEKLMEVFGKSAKIEFEVVCNSILETITFDREESDYEYLARLAREDREIEIELQKVEYERGEYERLKKKFEGEGSKFKGIRYD